MKACRPGVTVVFASLLLALLSPQLTAAQSPPANEEAAVRQAVSTVMRRYMASKKPPGAIVGVSVHGRRYFFHYGRATDNGAPFTPDTLAEIGSNTKTFTTALFSLAVARGQMEETESIQKHMPDGMKLEPLARQATAIQLASFQSGMPDDPTNLPPKLEMRSIEHYTTKDFLTWVAHWKPAVPPPAPYKYSNSGIGLLGYLIMDATGKTWEQQLSDEIVTPLGMVDTELRPSPDQRQRLARGHLTNGNDAPVWPIFAWYAAGGLRSTARDMLRYGEANLGHSDIEGKPVPPALTSAMQKAQMPIYPLPAPAKAHQAMAWVVTDANPATGLASVVWKDGGTAGFSSAVVLHHGKDIAIFVAINEARQPAPGLGIDIARHIP